MKKLLIPLVLLLALGAGRPRALAQAPSKTAVVRIFEAPSSRLFISYGGDKTEMQELKGIVGKKDQKANTEQLQAVIDRLYTEGFRLVGSTGSNDDGDPVSTLIFRKE